jgi:hypothetical protein
MFFLRMVPNDPQLRSSCTRRWKISCAATYPRDFLRQAVDQVLLVVGMIPKKLFKNNPEFWYKN